MISYDLHMHSNNSLDGGQSVDDACRAAIEKGLTGIAITDHVDVWFFDRENTVQRFINCMADVNAAREKYGDKLKIFMGIEMAEYLYDPERSERVLAAADYDVVLGSVHSVKYEGIDDSYSRIDFSVMPVERIIGFLDEYFDRMLDMIRNTDFDILTHLSCPLRYINGKYNRGVDIRLFEEKIRNVLKEIINRGISLEINTSGCATEAPYFMPEKDILTLYFKMGGRRISIGSDAHVSKNVGVGFDNALNMIKAIGFDHYVIYKNRTPISVDI